MTRWSRERDFAAVMASKTSGAYKILKNTIWVGLCMKQLASGQAKKAACLTQVRAR